MHGAYRIQIPPRRFPRCLTVQSLRREASSPNRRGIFRKEWSMVVLPALACGTCIVQYTVRLLWLLLLKWGWYSELWLLQLGPEAAPETGCYDSCACQRRETPRCSQSIERAVRSPSNNSIFQTSTAPSNPTFLSFPSLCNGFQLLLFASGVDTDSHPDVAFCTIFVWPI